VRLILLVLLILLLLGALPTWPYSAHWGYYPSGGLAVEGNGPRRPSRGRASASQGRAVRPDELVACGFFRLVVR
jgi:hypothetical protein